jgi:hypothetical protein
MQDSPYLMPAQTNNRANTERRFTHRRVFPCRLEGSAAHKSPPKTKAMKRHVHNQPTRHINISSLARRFGIPIRTAITPELVACYGQSIDSVAAHPAWLWDLLWTARRALAGQLPCRRESTESAELYHIGCSTFFSGRMEPEHIRCCVALSGEDDGDVRLTFRLSAPEPKLYAKENSSDKSSTL